MKNTSILPDDAQFQEGSYAWFHFQMIGKEFVDKAGKYYSKLDVWIENRKSPAVLNMIVRGSYNELKAVDKSGWKNGILILLAMFIIAGCSTQKPYQDRYTHYRGGFAKVDQKPLKIGRWELTLGTADHIW
jgi:hypothetical protein